MLIIRCCNRTVSDKLMKREIILRGMAGPHAEVPDRAGPARRPPPTRPRHEGMFVGEISSGPRKSRIQTDPLPVLDARSICSYNVHIGGEPLSTGLVFDIVYRTITDAGAKQTPAGIGARPRRQAP
jgi:hypothetical protein